MPNDNTPGAGKNAETTPDPGKQVTAAEIAEIVRSAIKAELPNAVKAEIAPITEQIGTLGKTVNSLAAGKRRKDEGKDSKDDDGTKDSDADPTEVRTLREKVDTLTAERLADRKKLALKDALDAHSETLVGRKHLEKLIGLDLAVNSAGEVVAVVDGKHVALKDHVATYANDPQWQKPSGTDGAGKPASGAKSGPVPKKSVARDDHYGIGDNMEAIAKGEVSIAD